MCFFLQKSYINEAIIIITVFYAVILLLDYKLFTVHVYFKVFYAKCPVVWL